MHGDDTRIRSLVESRADAFVLAPTKSGRIFALSFLMGNSLSMSSSANAGRESFLAFLNKVYEQAQSGTLEYPPRHNLLIVTSRIIVVLLEKNSNDS